MSWALPSISTRARRAGLIVGSVVALALAACATDIPEQREAPLRMPGGGIAAVTALSCRPSGPVLATAIETSGISQFGGVLLRSSDRGLNWEVLRPDEGLKNISPWFIEDPRDAAQVPRPLFVTGYRNIGFMSGAIFGISQARAIGVWLVSRDDGMTWLRASSLAPFAASEAVGADPQQLLQLDARGTLAFTRVERLGPYGLPRVLLERSREGGRTGVESEVPAIKSDPSGMVSDGHGRALIMGPSSVGTDADLVVLRSDDSGERWAEVVRRKHEGGLPWSVTGQLDGTLILWNRDERALKRVYSLSTDGGRTFSAREVAVWAPFRNLISDGPGQWVALSLERAGAAREAVFWISDDDAHTWSAHRTGFRRRQYYWTTTLVSAGNGALIAHVGGRTVLHSADRGETWQRQKVASLPESDFGFGAHCTDGNGLVVLADTNGMLIRSADSGATWQTGRVAGASP